MKNLKMIIASLLIFGMSLYLTSCANPLSLKKMDFELNNGSAVVTIEYRLDNDIVPPNPQKDGFIFDGWFWDNEVWSKPFTINSILDQPLQSDMNLKVYARWKNKNSIIFNANGGTGNMNYQVIAENGSAQLTVNSFSRQNYTFRGWATSPSGNTVYADGANFSMPVNGGLTLYAVWKNNTGHINYNSNNGRYETTQQNVALNANVSLLGSDAFAKMGYSLVKWNTKYDGTGTDYLLNQTYTYNEAENLLLYGIWQANTYTITYNANGGTGTMAKSEHTYDMGKLISANTFTKEGHTFAGWNTNADGDGSSFSNAQSVFNLSAVHGTNIIFYAQWTINKYTATITSENTTYGTVTGTGSYNFASIVTIVATPSQYYRFAGWYDDGVLVSANASYTFNMPAHNVAYQAKWEEVVVRNTGKNIFDGNEVKLVGPEMENSNSDGPSYVTYKSKLYAFGNYGNTAPARTVTIIDLATGEVDKIINLLGTGITLSVYNDRIAILVSYRMIEFYNTLTGMLEENIMLTENVSTSDSYYSRQGICYFGNYIYYSADNLVRRYDLVAKTTTTVHTETNAYFSRFSLDEQNKRMIIAFTGRLSPNTSGSWIKIYDLENNQIIGQKIESATYLPPVVSGQFVSKGVAYSTLDGTVVNDYSAFPKRFAPDNTTTRYNITVLFETSKYIVFNCVLYNKITNSFEFTSTYSGSYYYYFPMHNGEVCLASGSINLYSTFGYAEPKTINVNYTTHTLIDSEKLIETEYPQTPLHDEYNFTVTSSGTDRYIEKINAQTNEVLNRVFIVSHSSAIVTIIGVHNGSLYVMGTTGVSSPASDRIVYRINIETFNEKTAVYTTKSKIIRFYIISDKMFMTTGSSVPIEAKLWTLNLLTEQTTIKTLSAEMIVTPDYKNNFLYIAERTGNRKYYEIDAVNGTETVKTLSFVTNDSNVKIIVTTKYVFIGHAIYERNTMALLTALSYGTSSNIYSAVFDANDNYFVNSYGIWDTADFTRIYSFEISGSNVSSAEIIGSDIYIKAWWSGVGATTWRKITMPA